MAVVPYDNLVSIHAPTQGATTSSVIIPKNPLFQSTLPRRERRRLFCIFHRYIVWFQSTLPRRERQIVLELILESIKFQSTLPRRERRRSDPSDRRHQGFNPRSHAGSDLRQRSGSLLLGCFNPRSHAGSDKAALERNGYIVKFQSTLPRRERRQLDTAC